MKNSDTKQLWLTIIPSWLSGFVVALASLTVVIGTIVISHYQGSSLQQELFAANHSAASTSSFNFKAITDNLAQNQVISNLPLFLFWAGIGVVVYFFAVSAAGMFGNAVEIEREMAYVNAPRQRLLRDVVLHTIVRLVTLGVWVAYLQAFLRILLPYSLGAAHVAASSNVVSAIGYAALALVILAVSLHVHITMFRLILLRTRVFGSASEE